MTGRLQLGGWHRLWIALTAAWTIWVIFLTWQKWQQFELEPLDSILVQHGFQTDPNTEARLRAIWRTRLGHESRPCRATQLSRA
jgi:hypothetical protein